MEEEQLEAEWQVMGSEGDPAAGDSRNRCHPALAPSSESAGAVNGGGQYPFQKRVKPHMKTKKYSEEDTDTRTQREWTDEYRNSKNSSNREEAVKLESADEENIREAAGEQEENVVPSVTYNFDNPLMAINYSGEFKTSEDNFIKGCKWLVSTHLKTPYMIIRERYVVVCVGV